MLLLLAAVSQSDDDRNGVVEALRTLGVLRDPNPPPTVGRRAYVRWWERTRAALFLVAVLVGLGVVLAAVVGVTVLIAGFLLEQAIS